MAVQALEQVSNLYIMYSFTPQETRKKHSTITTDILARNSTMGNKHSQPEEITQPLVENAEEATRLSISAEDLEPGTGIATDVLKAHALANSAADSVIKSGNSTLQALNSTLEDSPKQLTVRSLRVLNTFRRLLIGYNTAARDFSQAQAKFQSGLFSVRDLQRAAESFAASMNTASAELRIIGDAVIGRFQMNRVREGQADSLAMQRMLLRVKTIALHGVGAAILAIGVALTVDLATSGGLIPVATATTAAAAAAAMPVATVVGGAALAASTHFYLVEKRSLLAEAVNIKINAEAVWNVIVSTANAVVSMRACLERMHIWGTKVATAAGSGSRSAALAALAAPGSQLQAQPPRLVMFKLDLSVANLTGLSALGVALGAYAPIAENDVRDSQASKALYSTICHFSEPISRFNFRRTITVLNRTSTVLTVRVNGSESEIGPDQEFKTSSQLVWYKLKITQNGQVTKQTVYGSSDWVAYCGGDGKVKLFDRRYLQRLV